MAVLLPQLNYMELSGFNKIFKENFFKIDFDAPLNILLGGNGLGKTTLLQCIVYALTGGMYTPETEEEKAFRWDYKFFKGRVYDNEVKSANILINFSLGKSEISIKRNINSNHILECFTNNDADLHKKYEEIIIEYGKYDSFDNFIFLVNRLLYLPENRRSLTWDHDAQTRSIMILCNNLIDEKTYRDLRAEIKNLDSAKRHTTVKINKIQKSINLKQSEYRNEDITSTNNFEIEINQKINERNEINLLLNQELEKRDSVSKELKQHEVRMKEIAEEINYLKEKIRKNETIIIKESLSSQQDTKNTIFFNKIINYGICPCCGEHSKDFQDIIQERNAHGKCVICGVDNLNGIQDSVEEIDTINSQLNEKLIARDNLNKQIFYLQNGIKISDDEIFNFRKQLNSLDNFKYGNSNENEDIYNDEYKEDELDLSTLLSDRDNLESDIRLKTDEADKMYASFNDNFTERYEQLSVIFKDLATSFLGKEVTLAYEKSPTKFVTMNYLIPVFDGEARSNPEDCSEAQRFFLDIAFRMSLIILNNRITNSSGTFICETPESALDVSYVENVVTMFFHFLSNNNRLILSNNLQRLGLAYLLASEAKSKSIQCSIFDLLEFGKLSDIQSQSKALFDIRDEIIKGLN